MTPESWAEVVVLAACVVVAAAASATETAMTSVGRMRVRHLAEEGSRAARVLHRLEQDPNRFLSTVLVTNTLALILASTSATLLGVGHLPRAWGVWGDFLVSLCLAFFLLVFAEVTPKTVAIRNADRIALAASGPLDRLASLIKPVLWAITLVSRAVSRGRAAAPYVTEQELMTILHVSEEQGVIEEEEREMIHGVISIGDMLVREVMVPRTDVTAVERTATLDEVTNVIRTKGHTRIPVYEGDLDHVVGTVHAKDVLLLFGRGRREFNMDEVLRPARFTPEQKKVDELLHEMQEEKVHMMIVVDEYGGTAGVVTLEDLLEEIVGEIRDEYDIAEPEPLTLVSDHEAVVDARFPIEDLNERLDLGIADSEEYDSVGGYIISLLGEIPEAGAAIDDGRLAWKVEEVDGRRIARLSMTSRRPWPRQALEEAGLPVPERPALEEGGA
ncbi:MAG: hemolysin family protein [Candidatus Dormibacterales bacterium]